CSRIMGSRRRTKRSRDRTIGSSGAISSLILDRFCSASDSRVNAMKRRTFFKSMIPAAVAVRHLTAQPDLPWGGPVLDTHLHLRSDADACFTHIQGCGVTKAVLLTPASDQERAKAEMEKRPGRFVRSVRIDPALPESGRILRDALKGGAVSIGELKFNLS